MTETVRYGRARLTVARTAPPGAADELNDLLDAFERGDARATSVATAFLRQRIVDHSPSFQWRGAKPTELIPIVCAVSDDPKLEATTPTELARALVHARAEREQASATPEPASPAPAAPTPDPSPAPVAQTPASPAAKPRRRFPLKLIPRTWKGRVAVVVVAGVIAGAAYGVDYYLSDVPDRLVDDFRREAAPAATRVADSMDQAYAAFDEYLHTYTIPRSKLRNADDFEELKRRLLPVYDATGDSLDIADGAIRRARESIERQRENLRGVPTAPLLDDSDSVNEARAAVRDSNDYLKACGKFLDDFERFVAFERKALALRRRDLLTRSEMEAATRADADLDAYEAAVERDLAYAQKSRRDHLELDPPPDAERLHEVAVEGATVTVDFLADVKAALENLDVAAYEAAFDNVIAEQRRLSRQESRAILEFEAKSGLQRSTQRLAGRADRLEETIRSLGTGTGDDSATDHARPDPPKLPPRRDGGSQDEEGSVA